jgi:hypothetical protein
LKARVVSVAFGCFLLATLAAANVSPVAAYTPQKGDYFGFSETISVNNGQGAYQGYTDQTVVTGSEKMTAIAANNISTFYSFSSRFSSSTNVVQNHYTTGGYTWSPSMFIYLNGTDSQSGYSSPVYVWFAMDPTLPVGGTFYSLNTQMTVVSKNYSLQLPTEGGRYVQAIEATGSGQYQRDDSYGTFTANYNWTEYFDPSTGYIIGYHYVEQDTNGQYQGQPGSFTYTDDLYVNSTSYYLVPATPVVSFTISESESFAPDFGAEATLALVVVILIIAAVAATRGRRKRGTLPEHSVYQPPPPPAMPQSNIDLGSQPSEQVVVREVPMVNCKYCGTLIPVTAETCPYCGAPRR